MQGWKEVLLAFGVTLSIGSLIGIVLLLNSGRKIDKSQQEIRQEKVTQAQSERSSESRAGASSTTVEVPEYDVDESAVASSDISDQIENHDMGDFYEDPYWNGVGQASETMDQDEYHKYMIGDEIYTDNKGIIWDIVYFRRPGTEAWGQASLNPHQDNIEVMEKIQRSSEYREHGYISRPQMLKQYLDSKNWDEE
ncbi:hypothetical protein [Ligilactobacillus animalis]|uniref:hypothetical protein n=1 Tax=Ligilactobacillus animalis TaxID=1605 RepID=UPI00266C274D|nr:hypothetical protein [Ligilactobacillus animalis]